MSQGMPKFLKESMASCEKWAENTFREYKPQNSLNFDDIKEIIYQQAIRITDKSNGTNNPEMSNGSGDTSIPNKSENTNGAIKSNVTGTPDISSARSNLTGIRDKSDNTNYAKSNVTGALNKFSTEPNLTNIPDRSDSTDDAIKPNVAGAFDSPSTVSNLIKKSDDTDDVKFNVTGVPDRSITEASLTNISGKPDNADDLAKPSIIVTLDRPENTNNIPKPSSTSAPSESQNTCGIAYEPKYYAGFPDRLDNTNDHGKLNVTNTPSRPSSVASTSPSDLEQLSGFTDFEDLDEETVFNPSRSGERAQKYDGKRVAYQELGANGRRVVIMKGPLKYCKYRLEPYKKCRYPIPLGDVPVIVGCEKCGLNPQICGVAFPDPKNEGLKILHPDSPKRVQVLVKIKWSGGGSTWEKGSKARIYLQRHGEPDPSMLIYRAAEQFEELADQYIRDHPSWYCT